MSSGVPLDPFGRHSQDLLNDQLVQNAVKSQILRQTLSWRYPSWNHSIYPHTEPPFLVAQCVQPVLVLITVENSEVFFQCPGASLHCNNRWSYYDGSGNFQSGHTPAFCFTDGVLGTGWCSAAPAALARSWAS